MKQFAVLLIPFVLFAQTKHMPYVSSLQKPEIFQWQFFDRNRINCTVASDGPYVDYRRTSMAGLEWPKGSGKTAIFTAGIWLAGTHRPTGEIRMSNMDYESEYQPGPVIGTFNTTTEIDSAHTAHVTASADPRYRIYKIEKRDTSGTTGNPDYDEWPGDLGAPFLDKNGNGIWDAGIDAPKFLGTFQMWYVINDINTARHANLSLSKPLGVEIQTTLFAFSDTLKDVIFLTWRIINKSDADYDDAHLSLWFDPDLGDANDDLSGCDSLLSLGYVYNGDNDDGTAIGYGIPPPAAGFAVLHGPRVPASPSDSALFGQTWIKGYKNISPSSSVTYFSSTSALPADPPDKTAGYVPVAYDYMRGMIGPSHQPLKGDNDRIINWWFSGDPVTGTGDLPSNFPLGVVLPQDVRIMLNMGPFTFAESDTQDIAAVFAIAKDTDRLTSVTSLKHLIRNEIIPIFNQRVITNVERSFHAHPSDFALKQNYPNPFNPTTEIELDVPEKGKAKLAVFDVTGRLVATVLEKELTAGTYKATFDASRLSSGVYFYRLTVGNYTAVRKMMLIR